MKTLLVTLVSVCLLSAVGATAQTPPTETAPLSLTALGGLELEVPAWKRVRTDAGVAVLERAADPVKNQDFGLLVVAIEEGPASTESVAWERIRDNIQTSSKESGSQLQLELGPAWDKTVGFVGRRMTGTLTANEREVAVEMVVVVSAGVMASVTLIGPKASEELAPALERVAASAKRPATP